MIVPAIIARTASKYFRIVNPTGALADQHRSKDFVPPRTYRPPLG
jgi:hypothetical protein